MMRKILAIRTDRFGEFLLNIPAFRALKETDPDVRLTVAVSAGVVPLARAIPFIDDVFVWPQLPMSAWQVVVLSWRILIRGFDAAIVLNPSAKAHQAIFLAGIPRRVGYVGKHDFLLTHKLPNKKHLGDKHEVIWNLELAGLLGAATKDRSLALNISADFSKETLGRFGLRDKEFIAVHPFTSDPNKQWSFDHFRELIRELARDRDVAVIGQPEEWQKVFSLEGLSRVVDLRGKTGLLELAAVLKGARLMVSGDSGPSHLACSVGTPVVALFRNGIAAVRPERWGPWGQGHRVVQANKVEDIRIDDVLAAVRATLASSPQGVFNAAEASNSPKIAEHSHEELKEGTAGLVSVVIPVYNRAYVLKRALESVLNQTYKSLEVIVVDDGSSDDVQAVLKGISDPRVRYIRHEKNKGVSAARNTGIRTSVGEFVAFLDSDDAYFPAMIERSLAVFHGAAGDLGLVAVNYYVQQESGRELFIPKKHDLNRIFPAPSSWVVRRDVLRRVGLFDERILITAGEDVEFFMRLRKGCRFQLIDEPLLDKFQSADSFFRDQVKMDSLKEATLRNAQGDPRLYARQAALFGKEFSGRGDKKRARTYFWKALCACPADIGNWNRYIRG
ncbi:MAG: glycosyltransferase [Candidatus Omnitrophica bacterium]|nr:glycosyltransferase [Candidatus Omnitrophota bacterium]